MAPSGPSPQQGVQQPSAVEAGASLVSDLFRMHAAGAPGRAAEAKAEQETLEQSMTGRFTRQQLQIAEAVDTGELSSQEARMRMRANLSAALADNPALTDAFTAAHSNVLETAGMGKVAAEGTEQEQAFFKTQDQAIQNGWVTQSMNQEQAREATFAYMQFQREQQKIDAEQNQLALLRARVGLQADRVQLGTARINQEAAALRLGEQKAQISAQTSAGSMADAGLTRIRTKAQDLRTQVENGNLAREEAVQLLDSEWLAISSSVKSIGAEAGGEYVNNLISPSEDIYNAYRGWITGETETATLEAISNNAIARQTTALTGDPTVARLVATSNLFKQNANLALQGPIVREALKAVEQNGNESGRPVDLTNPENQVGTQQYLQMLRDGVTRANTGSFLSNPEETQAEVRVNVNNVLKGVENYGNLVDSPRELNDVTQFLASDEFGRYVEQNGTAINQDSLGGARNVFEAQFDEVVRPLIAEEWRNASVTTSAVGRSAFLGTEGEQEAAPSLIRPFFSNGGVRFVIADDASSSTRLEARIRTLNNRVAPVVNRLVKLGAHLEGHRDYQRIYESNYAQLFGDAGTGAEVNE